MAIRKWVLAAATCILLAPIRSSCQLYPNTTATNSTARRSTTDLVTNVDARLPPTQTSLDTSLITPAPFYRYNSSSYITVTGYLDGDTLSPVVFANVTSGDCRFPDSTGTGSQYASCCNAIYNRKTLLEDGPFGHFQYPELYLTSTTLIPDMKWSAVEEACTHILWGVPIQNVTATSTTWMRNYSATASSRYTSFPCSIEGDDCDRLFTAYAENLESWRAKYEQQTMNEAIAKERAQYMVPSCVRKQPECNDECVIHAASADLYFFRPPSRSLNMCGPAPTPMAKLYTFDDSMALGVANVTVKLAEANSTVVKLWTNNRVYLHYGAVSTHRRRACTDVYSHGRSAVDVFVTLSSQEIFSMRYPLFDHLHPMDYGGQMNPYPYSEWAGGTLCSFDCRTVTPGLLRPKLALQTQLRQALPEWVSCELDPLGVIDPATSLDVVADAVTSQAMKFTVRPLPSPRNQIVPQEPLATNTPTVELVYPGGMTINPQPTPDDVVFWLPNESLGHFPSSSLTRDSHGGRDPIPTAVAGNQQAWNPQRGDFHHDDGGGSGPDWSPGGSSSRESSPGRIPAPNGAPFAANPPRGGQLQPPAAGGRRGWGVQPAAGDNASPTGENAPLLPRPLPGPDPAPDATLVPSPSTPQIGTVGNKPVLLIAGGKEIAIGSTTIALGQSADIDGTPVQLAPDGVRVGGASPSIIRLLMKTVPRATGAVFVERPGETYTAFAVGGGQYLVNGRLVEAGQEIVVPGGGPTMTVAPGGALVVNGRSATLSALGAAGQTPGWATAGDGAPWPSAGGGGGGGKQQQASSPQSTDNRKSVAARGGAPGVDVALLGGAAVMFGAALLWT